MAKRFSWDAAPAWVIRDMLEMAYRSRGHDDDADKVARLKKAQLVAQAQRTLGEPPHRQFFDNDDRAMADWLKRTWLPQASDSVVLELTQMVQARIGGAAAKQQFRSTNGRVRFLQERNVTAPLMTKLRTAFISSYKVDGAPRSRSGASSEQSTWIPLVGQDEPRPNEPYQHQEDAWARLDRAVPPIRGVLVLPTGAGKTDTMAVWLLQRMAVDDQFRVLWVAHQQELVDQALRRFQTLSHGLPVGFQRRARSIHSAGSSPSTLGETTLDLAGITIQSLRRLLDNNPDVVEKFLTRPTFIVIDEAHHAGSDSYARVIEHLGGLPTCQGIVGLTATPYPTGAAASARFGRFFPATLLEVSREDLTAKGILAQPRLHIIETGTRVLLTGTEKDQAIAADLPPAALRKLQSTERDAVLVKTWLRRRDLWGKTLVFATSIEHAEQLHELFQSSAQPAVPSRTLHSRSNDPAAEILGWFRETTEPCVLVSVGMLTEGVDLPDARTAILARPTTSRILMQQMVGRVLRGPTAGGDPEAHLVYLRDRWDNFGDVLEPPEVIPMAPYVDSGDRSEYQLPPIMSDDDATELPAEVAATVERLMAQARRSAVLDDDDPHNDRSLDPQLTISALAGYYELGERKLPVFEHQQNGYRELLTVVEGDASFQGTALLSFFEGDPPPFPTRRSLRDLVEYAREVDTPAFVELTASIGVDGVARALIDAGDLSAADRRRFIRRRFDSTLNRHAWRSFAHFEQAVDARIAELLDGPRRLDAERLQFARQGSERLPRRRRPLKPIVDHAMAEARRLLPPELADRLTDPPPVYWTRRVVSSTWGHWSIALGKKGAGRQQIRINRLLRTDSKLFPDDALAYLVFHELLHHLLPGQGHDAEFRSMERLWPDGAELDLLFDTLHEEWDTDPERYARDAGGPRDVE